MHNLEKEERIRVGITHGNADEYSYQVLAKVFSDPTWFDIAIPYAYAQSSLLGQVSKNLGIHDAAPIPVSQMSEIKGKKNLIWETEARPFAALSNAVGHLKEKVLKVLITLPLKAEDVRKEDPEFKATAYWLASQFSGNCPFRMMLSDLWKTSFMTSVHQGKVLEKLKAENIEERILALYRVMKSDFSITTPRIAVLSMNTDIESSSLCDADNTILRPLVSSLLEKGYPVFGPYTPSAIFKQGNEKALGAFDAILCIYKEQTEISDKYYKSDRVCAYTAGLPFIHLEPTYSIDSTPLDQAALNVAQAFYYAIDIERSKNLYARLTENQLICGASQHLGETEI